MIGVLWAGFGSPEHIKQAYVPGHPETHPHRIQPRKHLEPRYYRIAVRHPKTGHRPVYRIDVDTSGRIVAVWVEKKFHGRNTDNRQRVPQGGPTYRRVLTRFKEMRTAGEI